MRFTDTRPPSSLDGVSGVSDISQRSGQWRSAQRSVQYQLPMSAQRSVQCSGQLRSARRRWMKVASKVSHCETIGFKWIAPRVDMVDSSWLNSLSYLIRRLVDMLDSPWFSLLRAMVQHGFTPPVILLPNLVKVHELPAWWHGATTETARCKTVVETVPEDNTTRQWPSAGLKRSLKNTTVCFEVQNL